MHRSLVIAKKKENNFPFCFLCASFSENLFRTRFIYNWATKCEKSHLDLVCLFFKFYYAIN